MEVAAGPRVGSRSWEGLEELREEVKQSLLRFTYRAEELDDAVQETLLRAARFRHRLSDDARLRPWVMRIAQNVMRDRRRREKRLPRVEGTDELFACLEGRETIPGEDDPDELLEAGGEVWERAVVLRHFERALRDLPRSDQRVLDLWYSCPDDEPRASRVCEHSPALAKVRVFRARSRLVRLLRRRLALSSYAAGEDRLPRLESPTKERRGARCAAVVHQPREERGLRPAACTDR